jgi:7-carboxy-7-deazaguanine synthase
MFGKNAISRPMMHADGRLNVHSIFYTIQGEGPDAGRPALFIRLAGCNLRCWFCDTDFEKGTEYSVLDLMDKVATIARNSRCGLVVITGGEPLLQNIVPLVKSCNSLGIACSVETAGTLFYPELAEVFSATRSIGDNLIVCSPKTPKISDELEGLVGAWKYIIKAGDVDFSGLPVGSTQVKDGHKAPLFLPSNVAVPIYVQAMDEQDVMLNNANLQEAAQSAMRHGYRLGVQIHKLANLE